MVRNVDVGVSSHHGPNLLNGTTPLYELCPSQVTQIKGETDLVQGKGAGVAVIIIEEGDVMPRVKSFIFRKSYLGI